MRNREVNEEIRKADALFELLGKFCIQGTAM